MVLEAPISLMGSNNSRKPVYTIASKTSGTNSSTEAELQIFTLIEQSEEDKMITVQVTTLYVNLGVADSRACSKPFMIEIVADADVPSVSTTDPVGVYIEDGENIPLEISIGLSAGGVDSLLEIGFSLNLEALG
jgi:hypothetical protein